MTAAVISLHHCLGFGRYLSWNLGTETLQTHRHTQQMNTMTRGYTCIQSLGG